MCTYPRALALGSTQKIDQIHCKCNFGWINPMSSVLLDKMRVIPHSDLLRGNFGQCNDINAESRLFMQQGRVTRKTPQRRRRVNVENVGIISRECNLSSCPLYRTKSRGKGGASSIMEWLNIAITTSSFLLSENCMEACSSTSCQIRSVGE